MKKFMRSRMTKCQEITFRQESKDKKENLQMLLENVEKGAHSIIWMAIEQKENFYRSFANISITLTFSELLK